RGRPEGTARIQPREPWVTGNDHAPSTALKGHEIPAQGNARGDGATTTPLLFCPERAQEPSPGQRPGTPGKDPTASRPERAREPSPGQRPGEQTAPGNRRDGPESPADSEFQHMPGRPTRERLPPAGRGSALVLLTEPGEDAKVL